MKTLNVTSEELTMLRSALFTRVNYLQTQDYKNGGDSSQEVSELRELADKLADLKLSSKN